ncbi:MAG: hypothetical protein WCT07_02325 [Candidatus Paceibacterota bacterium]|jgi:hypothetical protein
MDKHIESLNKFLLELNELLSLASDDLLKSERLDKDKHEIEDNLKILGNDLDERSQLSIEKTIPKWRNMPKTGVFVPHNQALKELTPLISLINEIISKLDNKKTGNIQNVVVVEKGRPYEGRKYLRELFNLAKESIFIRDSYLRPVILDVLTEYVIDNPGLKLIFLVEDNKRLVAFKASVKPFKVNYNVDVEARFSSKENKDHPRYIVIDNYYVFNPDHSLDQWGTSSTNIHKILIDSAKEKILEIIKKEMKDSEDLLI